MKNTIWRFLIIALLVLAPTSSFAQSDSDDVYDPFSDYNEFEENSQEEADIFFFNNGRFFNVAMMFGWDQMTANLGKHAEASISPGLYLAYFFNLRFALQFAYTFSSHRLAIQTPNTVPIVGSMSYSIVSFHLKYYVNTQNVTRGLASLNPYFLLGLSQNYRTIALNNVTVIQKEDTTSFDFGLGIEIPIASNEMYIGLQAYYRFFDFPSENKAFNDSNGDPTGVTLNGDAFNAFAILGINF